MRRFINTRFKERGVIVTAAAVAGFGLAGLAGGVIGGIIAVAAMFGLMCGLTMIFVDPDSRY